LLLQASPDVSVVFADAFELVVAKLLLLFAPVWLLIAILLF
jgi:hypothetical protein